MRRVLTKVGTALKGRNDREANHYVSRPEGTREKSSFQNLATRLRCLAGAMALVEDGSGATGRDMLDSLLPLISRQGVPNSPKANRIGGVCGGA